ncbi:MAG: D-2-hydroxyacid dehydrogenase [Thermocladium sp.]|jgi:D-3-phosphoglycerate dehydrogenase
MGDPSGIKMSALITDKISERAVSSLKEHGFAVDYRPGISKEEMMNIIDKYDVLIVRSRTKVTADVIDRGKRLRIIARAGVGLDNIDTNYAVNRGIIIINSPKAATYSAAELAIGLMIGVARRINLFNYDLKNGKWSKGSYEGMELRGKSLGIIGFGRIGRAVAGVGKALGMNVNATDVINIEKEANELGVKHMGLEELLMKSDVITIHVSLTKNTFHLINDKALSLMKNDSILVNTSRGEVIDTKALMNYLDKLWGVGLDVLEHEPPREDWENELVKHPKVLVTPHIGAETREAQERMVDELIGNILEATRQVIQ